MKYFRFFIFLITMLAAGKGLFAGSINGGSLVPCTTAPLSSYISGSNRGCALGVLIFNGWSLGVINGGGTGPAPLTSSQILITPAQSANGLGGSFSFSAIGGSTFGVNAGQSESYFINNSFFIDPGPELGGADLFEDPGNVTTTQFFCNDLVLVDLGPTPECRSAINPTGSFNSPQTLQVTTANPRASILFSPPAFQFGSIETAILLDGSTGAANFDIITSSLNVIPGTPEPAAFALAFGGLAVLGLRHKYAKRR